jgi:hypothetical protein
VTTLGLSDHHAPESVAEASTAAAAAAPGLSHLPAGTVLTQQQAKERLGADGVAFLRLLWCVPIMGCVGSVRAFGRERYTSVSPRVQGSNCSQPLL